MKSKINHADLLRLTKLLGEAPSEELSAFFGFESEIVNKEQSLELSLTIANELINTKEEKGKNNLKPENEILAQNTIKIKSEYWYVDVVELLNTDYTPTTIKLKTQERSLVRPYVDALISLNQAKSEISNLLETPHKSKSINISFMISDISQGKVLEKVHYKQREQLPDVLYLLIDVSARLTPAEPELKRYINAARVLMGKTRLKVCPINYSPTTNGELVLDNGLRFTTILQPNNTVLYIGDGGSYSTSSIQYKYCWRQFWNKLSSLNIPNKQIILAKPSDAKPTIVNALMSAVVRCEGPEVDRIRHLRQAIAEGGLAEELAVWNHPDMTTPSYIADIKSSQLNKWGAVYQSLNPAIQSSFDSSIGLWRDYLHISTGAMEQLKSAALGLEEIRDPELILKLFGENQQTDSFKDYLGYRRDVIDFINFSAKSNEKLEYASRSLRNALFGESVNHYSQEEKTLSIKQQGQGLITSFDKLDKPLAQLTTPVMNHKGQLVSKLGFINQYQKELKLQDVSAYYQFKKTTKPSWADRIWQNTNGLFATHQEGTEFQLIPTNERDQSAHWQGTHNAWSWASDYGIDEYGLWAVLSVKKVDFKLRWIPKGTFLMGSPEDEDYRYETEIQHKVTLTKGYWLGKTSVNQAQWQAIMGSHSSVPKKSDLPVNNVSWNSCQTFIKVLKQLMPDFNPKLPSEAQWEYAIRAGSQSVYSWGDSFDETKADNMGSFSLESNVFQNSFGLCNMNGKVFEWCADFMGDYSKEAVSDPEGATAGRLRVVRGGGWVVDAQGLRLAYRNAYEPDGTNGSIGLRLAGGFDPQAGNKEAMLTTDRRHGRRRSGFPI